MTPRLLQGCLPASGGLFAVALALALVVVSPAPGRAQPVDAEALVQQGRTLFGQGRFDDAERLYRQALAGSPNSLDALRALGVVLTLKGQYPEARAHLQRAVRYAPTPVVRHQTRVQVALSYAFEGALDSVQTEYLAVRALQQADGDPGGAAASARSLGRILLEGGDVAGGRKWYEIGYQEWKPEPSDPQSERLLWDLRWHHMLARIAAREGRTDEARRLLVEFERIMRQRDKLREDHAFYRWVAGYVAFYARDYDAAITHLTQGDLGDPFILDLIGQAYEAKGQAGIARDYYQRVMASNVFNLQSAIARPHARARLAGGS